MGNVNMPITAIVQKGMPKPGGKSDSPKVSPAGWPMKDSPIKQIGVDKKDTKAFEKTKRLEARGDRKIDRLEKRKQKVVDRVNKKAERKSKRILGDRYGKSSPMKKISGACKAAAKKKFDVWPSAYASGWGVRCTRAGGPGKMGKSKK